MVFPVVMYACKLDHKEGWALKNWCFQIVVLEKTLESPLDWQEIKPVNPRGNHFWIFTGRAVAEVPILWPPDVKSQLIVKDPDDEGKKRREWQRMRWLHSFTDSVDLNLNELWEILKDRGAWRAKFLGSEGVRHDLAMEQQQHGKTNTIL